jgi:hypothetical protein
VEGACVYDAKGACCAVDGDCDDAVGATEDRCVSGACVHLLVGPEPCAAVSDCGSAGQCAAAECVAGAGLCSYSPTGIPGCCASDADCATFDPCLIGKCVAFACVATQGTGVVATWTASWTEGLEGWTVASDGTGAQWQPSGAQFTSGPASLYYGDLSMQNYDVGATKGTATSPTIAPPPGPVVLRFWIAPYVEVLYSVDKVWVEVLGPSGAQTVWSKEDIEGPIPGWKQVELDISALATGPFQVAVHFDSIDATHNDKLGVFVDDVEILGTCE